MSLLSVHRRGRFAAGCCANPSTLPASWAGVGVLLLIVLLCITDPALAQPPTMPLPSTTGDQNDLLNQFWGWAKFLLAVVLILVAAAMFIGVVWAGIGKFMEVARNRGSFLDVVPIVGVGLFVLVLGGVMLTIAWGVIQNTALTP